MYAVRFEFWQSKEDRQWYFHLIAPNGGVLVHSGAYDTEDKCLEGIEEVRRYARLATVIPQDVDIFN